MTKLKTISSISESYAKAIFDIAGENKSFEEIKAELSKISQVLISSNDLKNVLLNDSVSNLHKAEILDEIFKGKIDFKLLNLLKLLVEKKRINKFDEIFSAYSDMLQEKENKKHVQIISAIDLNDTVKTKILYTLHKKLNCDVLPDWQTDKEIIGGLIFKYDGNILDTSIRTKLNNLGKSIKR